MNKTLAMRQLDRSGIAYEVRTYPVDPDRLDAVHAAELLGLDPAMLYKTLVVRGASRTHYMACIPAPATLDLKKLARAAGEKSMDMVAVSQLEALTGYVRGGVSPLAAKRRLKTFIHEEIVHLSHVSVSAGRRGEQMLLSSGDLVRAADARLADLVRTSVLNQPSVDELPESR